MLLLEKKLFSLDVLVKKIMNRPHVQFLTRFIFLLFVRKSCEIRSKMSFTVTIHFFFYSAEHKNSNIFLASAQCIYTKRFLSKINMSDEKHVNGYLME